MAQGTRRDFFGYGGKPPRIRWPNDARVAVSVVVNFEEGAEFSVADGDAHNEAVYEVVHRVDGREDPCIDSHFEYGTRVGYWRLMSLLERFGVASTLSTCARAAEVSPWVVKDAIARGHEVSAHGYRWESHAGSDMDEAAERATIQKTAAIIEAATGKRPLGWHTRSGSTANTRRLLVEQGFLYDSDAYNDDLPYSVTVAGKPHLVLPYAFDTNDMQFQHSDRFALAADFATYVCDAFDWLWREGAETPRMMSIGLHLRIIARPGRIGGVEKILEHMQRKGGVWFATREAIARHWLAATGEAAGPR
ncbi:MAG TPA: polysaccharide deacetylase family protein [Magnetospirillaceae bacterium]|jgi:peptidoglycan/xylan/chitin deacetylase (PgdA/CDA1 family)